MKKAFLLALCLILSIFIVSCTGNTPVNGENGVSILKTEIIDGYLWITYSNAPNTPVNVGKVSADATSPSEKSDLDFYPLPDGTYGVRVGNSLYLEEITIPGTYNGKSVSTILNSGFCGASNLKSIIIPDTITTISNSAFEGCSGLSNVAIGSGVTCISERAFYGCTSLTSLSIPNSVTNIGESAFYGCIKLVEIINHSSLNIENGSANNGFVGYYAIDIHTDKSRVVAQDGYLFYTFNDVNYLVSYTGADTELILPDSINGKSYKIASRAFYDCTNLTSVIIPNNVTSIGDDAFYRCTNLTSIWSYCIY